jgi:hypothetical protein
MGQVALLSDKRKHPRSLSRAYAASNPCGGQPPAREIFPFPRGSHVNKNMLQENRKREYQGIKRQRHLFIGMLSVCQAAEAIALSESGSLTAVSSRPEDKFPAVFA